MMLYTPNHFNISEFLPKEVFNLPNVNPFWFMNPKILWTADQIRIRYKKPVFVNTWMFKGMQVFNARGFRPKSSNVGADLSQHYLGNANDFNVDGMSAAEVQDDILKHQFIEPFQYITCLEIEDGVEKTHIDCRPHNKQKFGIFVVKKR